MRKALVVVVWMAAVAVSLGAEPLRIPFGVAPVVDGTFTAAEWYDATTVEFVAAAGAVHVRVHLVHDATRLYIAFEYVENPTGELVIPEILIDPNDGKAAEWQADDWWFHVSAQDCDAQGGFDNYARCGITRPLWSGMPNFQPDPNSVALPAIEVQIPLSMVSLAPGAVFGLSLTVNAWPSDTRGYWPEGAEIKSPATWGEAILAADVPPMEVIELSDRAIVVRQADSTTANQTLAVATSSGIILVDSQPTPTLAKECRRLVAEHFGRSDFSYLIITHDDVDHIGGTGAFPDVTIVAQQACATITRGILGSVRQVTANLRVWDENRIASLQAELAGIDAASERASDIRAEIIGCEIEVADFRAGLWVPRVPDVTFAETWTLDAGDTTVTCWFLGLGHSESDIFVHFETEGILAVGDAMSKQYLCLGVDPELTRSIDVGHWCQMLDLVLEKSFDTVVWGHRGFLTHDDVANRASYIRALWEGVVTLKAGGGTLADAHTSLVLANLFPNLAPTIAEMALLLGLPEATVAAGAEAQHAATIDMFWAVAR